MSLSTLTHQTGVFYSCHKRNHDTFHLPNAALQGQLLEQLTSVVFVGPLMTRPLATNAGAGALSLISLPPVLFYASFTVLLCCFAYSVILLFCYDFIYLYNLY